MLLSVTSSDSSRQFTRGDRVHAGNRQPYGCPVRTGDVVEMIVDMELRTLTFVVNGNIQGIAFAGDKLPIQGPLYAAASSYSVGDSFQCCVVSPL